MNKNELLPLLGKKVKAKVKFYSYHDHLTEVTGIIAFADDNPKNDIGIRANEWFSFEDIKEIEVL